MPEMGTGHFPNLPLFLTKECSMLPFRQQDQRDGSCAGSEQIKTSLLEFNPHLKFGYKKRISCERACILAKVSPQMTGMTGLILYIHP